MSAEDVTEQAARFLRVCGSCDAGLPSTCACPAEDYRPVMACLVDEIRQMRIVESQLRIRLEREMRRNDERGAS